MFAGKDSKGADDAVFIGINSYWEKCSVQMPDLPSGYKWNVDFYTDVPHKTGIDYNKMVDRQLNKFTLAPRSVIIASMVKVDIDSRYHHIP